MVYVPTGNKIGKPPIYETPDQLEKKMDEYFAGWFRTKKVWTDDEWNDITVPLITMTDLAIYLWFESRQSMYDYWSKKDYSYIIKRATIFIEREYEERLNWTTPTWAIFALKNMGWKDKTEVEQNTKMEMITVKLPSSEIE